MLVYITVTILSILRELLLFNIVSSIWVFIAWKILTELRAKEVIEDRRRLVKLNQWTIGETMTKTTILNLMDLLILKTLALEPMHGWGVSKRIREMSEGVLDVNQGSLYPGLYRLRDRGLIRSRWEITEEERRVKVYELTKAGHEALRTEQDDFRLFVGSVERILGTT